MRSVTRLVVGHGAVTLQVVSDHYSDVYGLDSHPQRPFVYASSSRDTTLRFWTAHGEADHLKVRRRQPVSLCSLPSPLLPGAPHHMHDRCRVQDPLYAVCCTRG